MLDQLPLDGDELFFFLFYVRFCMLYITCGADDDVLIQVLVSVTNSRDNNSLVKSIKGDVVEIIRREVENKELKGFTFDGGQHGVVSYVTRGRCSFRYGSEQHVQLSQEKLTDTAP